MRLLIKFKKLNKIGGFLKKLPWLLAKNAFVVSLALILIAAILGGLVLYEYGLAVKNRKADPPLQGPVFDEAGLLEILNLWQERQKGFDQTEFKEYSNPFKPSSELP